MTDPEWADATYLEPLDAPTLAEIIGRERPDALLPTLGGQTALNLAVELAENGVLAEHGVELIGADLDAIRTAEDRSRFRAAMAAAGLPVPESVVVTSLDQLDGCPVPAVVRPAFTLGGRGGGLARTRDELRATVSRGIAASPIGQVLVERSLEGWQEFELEVVVDTAGNCIVVCSIENLDPVGVHTGDSWTVAPQQTLPDGELQRLRDAAFTCARAVGVATGGANVQFAYEPRTRELQLIEMNPRVSRSSALASKATGFPIAKLAALLAVGYTLDELPNDITGVSSAAFEPALDYVAVKAPRFDFEKFPGNSSALGTEMRAVGEALGIGRTFPEALLKALDGVEAGDTLPEIPGLHPYFADELASIRDAEQELLASGDVAGGEAVRAPRRADRAAARDRGGRGARPPRPPRPARRRLLRRRVRRADALLLPLARAGRRGRDPGRRDRRARLGDEPDRAGDRVRLLLRPRGAGVPAARARGRARQLEPGDGLDRLRHLRPPLPRAGHARARARRRRAGAAARRRRLARRADAARARGRPRRGGRTAAGRPARRDRPGRGPRPLRHPARRARPEGAGLDARADDGRGPRVRDGGRLPGARPPLVRARRPRHARRAHAGGARARRPGARRPLPRRRARARRRHPLRRRATAGSRRSSSTSSAPASTRATRPACCPRPR